jgi:hypothetical protein
MTRFFHHATIILAPTIRRAHTCSRWFVPIFQIYRAARPLCFAFVPLTWGLSISPTGALSIP